MARDERGFNKDGSTAGLAAARLRHEPRVRARDTSHDLSHESLRRGCGKVGPLEPRLRRSRDSQPEAGAAVGLHQLEVPPCACAIPRLTDRPSPVPWPTLLVVKNGSNTWLVIAAGTPGPSSLTSTNAAAAVRRCGRGRGRAGPVRGTRLFGVDEEVQDHLADFLAIDHNQRQIERVVLHELDAALRSNARRRASSARCRSGPRQSARASSGARTPAGSGRSCRPVGAHADAVEIIAHVAAVVPTISSSAKPSTACSGLFNSCATPATSWPTADSRSL